MKKLAFLRNVETQMHFDRKRGICARCLICFIPDQHFLFGDDAALFGEKDCTFTRILPGLAYLIKEGHRHVGRVPTMLAVHYPQNMPL